MLNMKHMQYAQLLGYKTFFHAQLSTEHKIYHAHNC